MIPFDPEIRDQAYQFFIEEALEFLQTLEQGLLTLREDVSIPKVHSLMRAAHSIKGGAASVDLEAIKIIAHRLEDVFRALYRDEGTIDLAAEELLLQAYDCLQKPLLEQIQTGQHDAETALIAAEPIFAQLEERFAEALQATENELPTAAELGIDITQVIFAGDVAEGLTRLEDVLSHTDTAEVAGEFRAQAEVFAGVGELVNLSGFVAIAHTTIAALQAHPTQVSAIAQAAFADFQRAQAIVLAGDDKSAIGPSDALLQLLEGSSEAIDSADVLRDPWTNEMTDGWMDLQSESVADGLADSLVDPLADSLTDSFTPGLTDSLNDLFAGLPLQVTHDASDSSPDHTPEALDNAQKAVVLSDPMPLEGIFGVPDRPIEPLQSLESEEVTIVDLLATERTIALAALENPEPTGLIQDEVAIYDSGESNLDDQGLPMLPSESLDAIFGKPAVSTVPAQSEPITESVIAPIAPISPTSPPSTPSPASPQKGNTTTPFLSNTVKVDLHRLERLNNLFGELITQENGAVLQTRQLQNTLNIFTQRFSHFEAIAKAMQDWADKSHNGRAKIHSQSSLLNTDGAIAVSTVESPEFDPLQMDSYNELYRLVQEAIEEIAQLGEATRDTTQLIQQIQTGQQHKHQTLKQVRNDLLWVRMFPVGDTLQRFPRMVRDLAARFQKQVTVKLSGTNTLIDKAVLEKLYDPLVHLVRNAFDHGVELPGDRVAQSKSAQATIEIRAYYRGNQTYIEVSDDGQGINIEKVRAKAVTQNLISEDEAKRLSTEQIYEFLFAPGFSTADKVSELSGRGVGLDTVRSQVRNLKGNITLTSEPGKGTTFTLRLPLTLTIAKLLVFSLRSNLMAVPTDTLSAIVSVTPDEIQTIQGRSFYYWRDQLVPLYPSEALLNQYPIPRIINEQIQSLAMPQTGKIPLLLITGESEVFALQVDQILQEQELVIKPFGKAMTPPPYLYGCTILGDGSLVPVLDGQALSTRRSQTASMSVVPTQPIAANITKILVVDDSLTTRQTLAATLKKSGYQTVLAKDGREALTQLQRHSDIQAVFCDVEMPTMNGFEFLAQCRQEFNKMILPVIMVTSRSGDKHRRIAQALGANSYLTKPYLEQDLLKTLNNCLHVEV